MIRQSFEHSPAEHEVAGRDGPGDRRRDPRRRLPAPAGREGARSCRAWSRSWSTGRSATSSPRARRCKRAARAAAEPQPEAAAGTEERARLEGAARQPTQPRRADPARTDSPGRRPAGGRKRLRHAQHSGDLGRGGHLEPDLLRTLRQQTRRFPRRLRRQRRRGLDATTPGLRGGRRQAGGDRRRRCGRCSSTSPATSSLPASPSSTCRPRARSRSTAPTR